MDLTDLSARDLSQRISAGSVRASEAVDAYLGRIEALNPKINAIVALRDRDAVMAEARALDGTPSLGPLHGFPLAIKDLTATAGIRTTKGSPLFADHVPEADEMLARRLRAAGAILIGKTNTPEQGLGSHTFNPVYGATRNPYDLSRTPGGSSGGAAAALAARMLPVADGSDMMGSLRNPAAFCNVYGMRPSFGLVPQDPGRDRMLHQLSTDGPMARNPGDLRFLLDILAAPDPRWPHQVIRQPVARPGLAGKRIGWLADWGGALPFEDGILALCETALRQMGDCGAKVEPLSPPLSREAVWDSWTTLRSFSVACSEADSYANPNARGHMKEALVWEIERGLALSGRAIAESSRIRATLYSAFAELFERFDALVMPSAQVWPFPVEMVHPTEIAGVAMDTYHRWMEVVVPVSLTGLAAISVPVGFGSNGLPMGMQLIGPRGSDDRLIDMAEAWHQMTLWPDHRPLL